MTVNIFDELIPLSLIRQYLGVSENIYDELLHHFRESSILAYEEYTGKNLTDNTIKSEIITTDRYGLLKFKSTELGANIFDSKGELMDWNNKSGLLRVRGCIFCKDTFTVQYNSNYCDPKKLGSNFIDGVLAYISYLFENRLNKEGIDTRKSGAYSFWQGQSKVII